MIIQYEFKGGYKRVVRESVIMNARDFFGGC